MDQKTIPPEKARQGRRGWHVLAILVVGLALALVAWYAAEWSAPPVTPPAEGTAN
ncbi:hypothetical protein [Arvimicrobium flavum]|uniref:hypothetical protein n=1 Tax=Arvimicrobium flavum TaxID=3393320 RepID=UPI00237B23CC|nr:hypothetical protein [Mesorhizobium shangrilense]